MNDKQHYKIERATIGRDQFLSGIERVLSRRNAELVF